MNTNVCRVCLSQELLMNIFKKNGSLMISTKLMSLTKVHITPEDGLPTTICSKCVQKLEECIEFIKLCENTDVKLRSLVLNMIEVQMRSDENLVINDKHILENDNFFANDNTLSPKSDGEKVLLIDESVDCSLQSVLNDDVLDDHDKIQETQINPKVNSKKMKQQCFTCGKVMSSRFRLKTHLRTHTGERPFKCTHCNKTFSLAQNLKVHIRTHTGEKPLQCTICGQSFAQSAGLAAHKRKHTGQLPYTCRLCPRSFRTVGHLQYHVRRHTGEKNFDCDTCGHAFITRSDLKQHLLTHTGERPHVCCVCGLRLTRASHLKRHIKLHDNPNSKGLFCEKCQLKFTKKADLDLHLKIHCKNQGL